MYTLFLIAARNLAQHRRRTMLLGGAISAVMALLVILMALSGGIRETMLRSATTLMTGHLNVAGFYKVSAGQSAPVVTDYKKVAEVIRKTVPELDYMVDRGRGWGRLVSDTASTQVGLAGIDITTEPGFKKVVQLKEGNLDALSEPNSILIFESQAKKLEVKLGDALTFSTTTSRGVSNTADLKIVAVARDIGLLSNFNVFVPANSLRKLYQINDDTTGALMVYLKDIGQVPGVQARLRSALEKEGFRMMDPNPVAFWMKFDSVNREDWTGQKLDITSWEDEISFLNWALTGIEGLTVMLISILLVIIVVGIMNTMWIAIRERTREIGTLRAIGMQRRSIMMMFLFEAGLLGLIGTALGSTLGLLVILGLNAMKLTVPLTLQVILLSDTLRLAIRPSTVLFYLVSISFITTLAALYPAFRAARLRPVTAMHHIG